MTWSSGMASGVGHHPESGTLSRVPRTYKLGESSMRTTADVEPPVIRIGAPTRIVNATAMNPQAGQVLPHPPQVLKVLLREVDVGLIGTTGRNTTFGVKVPTNVVNHIVPCPNLVIIQERSREFDHEEMSGPSFIV